MGQVRWKMWLPDKNVTKCHEIRAQSLWCCPLGIQTVLVSVTGILARGDRQEQADNSHAVCPIDKLIFIQNVKCTRLTWIENKVRVNSIHCIANKAVVQWNDAEICKQNFPYGYKCVIIDEFCVQDRKHTRRQQSQHSDRIVGTLLIPDRCRWCTCLCFCCLRSMASRRWRHPASSQRNVRLPDGSAVHMDSLEEIRDPKERGNKGLRELNSEQ